jgi:hypothetical protein
LKIKYTEEQHKLLRLCQVPSGLIFDQDIDWEPRLQAHQEIDGDKVLGNFSLGVQKKIVHELNALYDKEPCIYVAHSMNEIVLLRRFIVPWFWNAVKLCKKNSGVTLGQLPIWHYVDFTFQDSLLNILLGKDPNENFDKYQPLIVLDGINTDSSSTKIEKLRDILNLSVDHVVILIITGKDPITFCKNKLNFECKKFFSFGSSRTRQVL